MMKPTYSYFSGYYVGFLFLQVMTSTPEKWTVITPMGHLVATVGGQAELSCQLSPPQSAEHMEVSWFKGNHSKLVHLYRDGHGVTGNAAAEYADRIEFVKELIGDGKVTLRLHNISISDNGPYQCSFKDSEFRGEAGMNLIVTALGFETQINIQAPSTEGLMVECKSGGWFPQPQMEWRDNKGEVVPHLSKSYSQDEAGLFYVKMIVFLRNKSQGNVICYIRNPLSGEGKQINIFLADALFDPVRILLIVLISIFFVVLLLIGVLLLCQYYKITVLRCDLIHLLNTSYAQLLCFGCSCIMPTMYLFFRKRVSLSDPLFFLYNDWIWDISIMAVVLMIFYGVLILLLYLTIKGVMESTGLPLPRHFFVLLLFQMIAPSSEQFTVTGLQGLTLAPLGGVLELSCQLSPPKSAEHMEIRWFRDRYTQPVHLYKNGKDLYGETISRYVERTELLKGAIREGKVTLRIFNVSVDDDGQYHCFFRDGEFYEEAIKEVKVTATSLEIQIRVHPPNIKGLLVECNSRGWFPQPQMEWRDSKGGVIPSTSKAHSQDVNKLFNMKMTLLLTWSFRENITCYLRNPVTGQEERTSIALSNQLFPWNTIWIMILSMILTLLLIFVMVPCIDLHRKLQNQQQGARCSSQSSVCPRVCTKDWCTGCCKMKSPLAVGTVIIVSSLCVNSLLISYLHHKSRVPASDPHFQLDTVWLEDVTMILCVLSVFITMTISFTYFRFRGFLINLRY